MLDTVTGNLADNNVFITVSSMGDLRTSFIFFIFLKLFFHTVSLTMVIKISPGAESAGGGR